VTLTLRCQDHGFECDFILEGEKNIALLKKTKYFEEEYGIDYTFGNNSDDY